MKNILLAGFLFGLMAVVVWNPTRGNAVGVKKQAGQAANVKRLPAWDSVYTYQNTRVNVRKNGENVEVTPVLHLKNPKVVKQSVTAVLEILPEDLREQIAKTEGVKTQKVKLVDITAVVVSFDNVKNFENVAPWTKMVTDNAQQLQFGAGGQLVSFECRSGEQARSLLAALQDRTAIPEVQFHYVREKQGQFEKLEVSFSFEEFWRAVGDGKQLENKHLRKEERDAAVLRYLKEIRVQRTANFPRNGVSIDSIRTDIIDRAFSVQKVDVKEMREWANNNAKQLNDPAAIRTDLITSESSQTQNEHYALVESLVDNLWKAKQSGKEELTRETLDDILRKTSQSGSVKGNFSFGKFGGGGGSSLTLNDVAHKIYQRKNISKKEFASEMHRHVRESIKNIVHNKSNAIYGWEGKKWVPKQFVLYRVRDQKKQGMNNVVYLDQIVSPGSFSFKQDLRLIEKRGVRALSDPLVRRLDELTSRQLVLQEKVDKIWNGDRSIDFGTGKFEIKGRAFRLSKSHVDLFELPNSFSGVLFISSSDPDFASSVWSISIVRDQKPIGKGRNKSTWRGRAKEMTEQRVPRDWRALKIQVLAVDDAGVPVVGGKAPAKVVVRVTRMTGSNGWAKKHFPGYHATLLLNRG